MPLPLELQVPGTAAKQRLMDVRHCVENGLIKSQVVCALTSATNSELATSIRVKAQQKHVRSAIAHEMFRMHLALGA